MIDQIIKRHLVRLKTVLQNSEKSDEPNTYGKKKKENYLAWQIVKFEIILAFAESRVFAPIINRWWQEYRG